MTCSGVPSMVRTGLLLSILSCVLVGQGATPTWTSLFDGKTLKGWVVRSGFADYKVEDGCIVGSTRRGSPNTFLCTERVYGDFVFEADFKLDPRLNSGIQFRSELREGKHGGRVNGYQYEIDSSKRSWTAGIFDEARRGWIANLETNEKARLAFRRGGWNHCRIVAQGARMQTFLNGVPAADHLDTMSLHGFIGLQIHGIGGREVLQGRWRNLRIRELGKSRWVPLGVTEKDVLSWKTSGSGTWKSVPMDDGNNIVKGSHAATEPTQGFLVSNSPYTDFAVRFQVRPTKGNSGFFFHSELVQQGARMKGLQVEIDATRGIGDLYQALGKGWVAQQKGNLATRNLKAGEWNSVVVQSIGGRAVVHVNDRLAVDVEGLPGPKSGHFGLQLHGGENVEIEFRGFEMLKTELR